MLEQEIASAIKFILESAGGPTPYYHNVPQGFLVPAVYFPPPEIISAGDTLLTYSLEYSWYVKFFHRTTQKAQALAFAALTALQSRKNVVPLIDETGKATGRGFRMMDPLLKPLDNAAQLTLIWKSPRPYNVNPSQKMMTYDLNMATKEAFDSAVSQITETEG